ncbi:beta-glucosidase C [Verticillium dahliae]
MNRPAVVPEVAVKAAALFASYGSSPDVFLDVVFLVKGAEPKGKLPIYMASSDQAVDESFEDLPFDTKDALFRFGYGLRYNVPACIPSPQPTKKSP